MCRICKENGEDVCGPAEAERRLYDTGFLASDLGKLLVKMGFTKEAALQYRHSFPYTEGVAVAYARYKSMNLIQKAWFSTHVHNLSTPLDWESCRRAHLYMLGMEFLDAKEIDVEAAYRALDSGCPIESVADFVRNSDSELIDAIFTGSA